MSSAIIQGISAAVFIVCATFVSHAHAHGRLIEPPSRSSMWRFGFNTPKNYDDNQLFCGGFARQWRNQGRCGVCGDPYDGPRENEAGGRYGTGTIVRRYQEGQTITVTLDITKNHGGYFEFRLCPNNDPSRRVTESCLNRNLLRQPNGEARWRLTTSANGQYSAHLVLPRGLTCTQCVLQWKWNTASNWGCEAGQCGKGLGQQEQFYGCADVSILSTSSGSGFQGSNAQKPVSGTNVGAGSHAQNPMIGVNTGAGPNVQHPMIGANFGQGANVHPSLIGANVVPGSNVHIPAIGANIGQGSNIKQPVIGANIGQGPSVKQPVMGANNGQGSNAQNNLIGANIGMFPSAVKPAIGGSTGHSSNNNIQSAIGGSGLPNVNALGNGGGGFIPIGVQGPSSIKCKGVAEWKAHYMWADQWCETQCAAGNCPPQYCQDGCRKLYGL